MVCQSTHRKETWKDIGVHLPTGIVTRDVKRGTEPKSRTVIVFDGPFEWTRQNRYALASLVEVLRMRFRNVLREDLGGTYDVSVSQSSERDPRQEYQVTVDFGSSPERADTLRAAVFREIERIKRDGPTAEEIEKVREIQRRGEETGGQTERVLGEHARVSGALRSGPTGDAQARRAAGVAHPDVPARHGTRVSRRVSLCAGPTPARVVTGGLLPLS